MIHENPTRPRWGRVEIGERSEDDFGAGARRGSRRLNFSILGPRPEKFIALLEFFDPPPTGRGIAFGF